MYGFMHLALEENDVLVRRELILIRFGDSKNDSDMVSHIWHLKSKEICAMQQPKATTIE